MEEGGTENSCDDSPHTIMDSYFWGDGGSETYLPVGDARFDVKVLFKEDM